MSAVAVLYQAGTTRPRMTRALPAPYHVRVRPKRPLPGAAVGKVPRSTPE